MINAIEYYGIIISYFVAIAFVPSPPTSLLSICKSAIFFVDYVTES